MNAEWKSRDIHGAVQSVEERRFYQAFFARRLALAYNTSGLEFGSMHGEVLKH